jgi:hypothetical protein
VGKSWTITWNLDRRRTGADSVMVAAACSAAVATLNFWVHVQQGMQQKKPACRDASSTY